MCSDESFVWELPNSGILRVLGIDHPVYPEIGHACFEKSSPYRVEWYPATPFTTPHPPTTFSLLYHSLLYCIYYSTFKPALRSNKSAKGRTASYPGHCHTDPLSSLTTLRLVDYQPHFIPSFHSTISSTATHARLSTWNRLHHKRSLNPHQIHAMYRHPT